MRWFDRLIVRAIDEAIGPALMECTDEGVRLGIGGAIMLVERMCEDSASFAEREVLAEVADLLRSMSADYAAAT